MKKIQSKKKANPTLMRVVIHGIDHARVACKVASKISGQIELWSANGAAGFIGPAWFQEIINLVRLEFPQIKIDGVLDCGTSSGYALAALRQGITHICISSRYLSSVKLKQIAQKHGAVVETHRPVLLDLGLTNNPEESLWKKYG